LWFAGVDFPKIHTSKHKHQQNLAGVTPENPVTHHSPGQQEQDDVLDRCKSWLSKG
jgi:hypothetical protein